jgi:carboxymethylenebutenolidase
MGSSSYIADGERFQRIQSKAIDIDTIQYLACGSLNELSDPKGRTKNRSGKHSEENIFMKTQNAPKGERPISATNSNSDLGALFDGHIAREFADFDVDATMETMVAEPYVHCVATLAGGFGGQEVRRFYSEHFINQIPKDAKVTPISRTIGKDQVVDELIVSFTHNTQWDYLLPGIPPTGNKVELPHVVVMKFENGKVAHEHVWWDQASLLVQVGLLDPASLPVVGIEQAKKLLGIAKRRGDGSTAAAIG